LSQVKVAVPVFKPIS